jgi:KRAB domain-containing zinc finger protein
MEDHQEMIITLFCCPLEGCGKEYKSKFNLKRHVEFNHLGKKPFVCPTCSRLFVSKQNLTEHQFIHSGIKPYKCNNCGQKFRQISQLSLHKRTHNSDYQTTLHFAIELQRNE